LNGFAGMDVPTEEARDDHKHEKEGTATDVEGGTSST